MDLFKKTTLDTFVMSQKENVGALYLIQEHCCHHTGTDTLKQELCGPHTGTVLLLYRNCVALVQKHLPLYWNCIGLLQELWVQELYWNCAALVWNCVFSYRNRIQEHCWTCTGTLWSSYQNCLALIQEVCYPQTGTMCSRYRNTVVLIQELCCPCTGPWEKLKCWPLPTSSLAKRVQPCLHFLLWLKKMYHPRSILSSFYRVPPKVTSCITVWCGDCQNPKHRALKRVELTVYPKQSIFWMPCSPHPP